MSFSISILFLLLGAAYSNAADSCSGRCGSSDLNSYDCQCSGSCISQGNCCSDYNVYCDTTATCAGRDCHGDNQALPCQCNTYCTQYNDCCPDYQSICVGSCQGRCGPGTDTSKDCQCNSYCQQYGDCCSDYESVCLRSTMTTSPGGGSFCTRNSVSNAELLDISFEIWNLDVNSASPGDIIVNVQGATSQGSTQDVAPEPFFTYVNEEILKRDTFVKLQNLQDNYIRTQGNTEVVTSQELDEIDVFLDAVLATDVGTRLFEFLDSKGLAGCDGMSGFKTILYNIWFGMYDRKADDDTSGFEHSFVGEIKGTGVSGFHNWVKFYHEEQAGNMNYLGHLSILEPDLYGMTFTWYGADKPINSITVGTSPEIELALYTLCHLSRPGSKCYIRLADDNGSPVDASIQTYTWSKSSPPGGQSYVATAYFIS